MTFASNAYAQNAPEPERAPPRVPFTAFRMKPILDPKLQAEAEAAKATGSVVVKDDVKAILKPKILGVLPIAKPQHIVEPTVQLKVETIVPPTVTLPDNRANRRTPNSRAIDDIVFEKSAGGLPLPPRKPNIVVNDNAPYVPPMTEVEVASIPEAPEVPQQPRAPEIAADPDQVIVPPSPVSHEAITESAVRIRDPERSNRSRFSSQSRMAGSDLDIGYGSSSRGEGLPDELRSVRVGKLEEAEGISPIIIPKQGGIPHAPDMANAANQKLPPEVIVFFQENSDELEVGQIEVLNSDVIDLLRQRPDLDVEVVAYAEAPSGNSEMAKKLSQARAVMIRDYLVRKKIDASRVQVTAKANNTKIDPRDRADLFFSR